MKKIMFDEIFDPDEYDEVRDKVHEFLKKEFGGIDTIRVGFYVFIYAPINEFAEATCMVVMGVCGTNERNSFWL